MNLFVPSSPKLTELLQKRETLKAKSKEVQAETVRLGRLLHAGWVDTTVTRSIDSDVPTASYIGIKPRRDQAGVVATGDTEQSEAARRQQALERTLAGESLADILSTKEQHVNAQRQRAALEDAIEHLSREIERESDLLKEDYAKSLGSQHTDMMVKLSKTVVDAHTAYAEVYGLKRHLIDSGVNLRRGLCNTMPEFLGNPSDSFSDMAAFLTAAKQKGWIKEVPAQLRIKVAK